MAIILLATVLRFYQLGEESLWIDEFNSLKAVDNFYFGARVVYFALLKVWMNFGTSDAWLRSLAVIFGIGCIPLMYQVGYLLVGRSVGIISTMMISVSPLFIFTSQEVRMYSLCVFLNLAGTLFLILALEKRTFKTFVVWGVLRVLLLFTVPLNILLLLPDGLVILLQFRNRRRALMMLAGGLLLIGLSLLPVFHSLAEAAIKFASLPRSPVTLPDIASLLPSTLTYWPRLEKFEHKWFYYIIFNLTLGFLFFYILFSKRYFSKLNWLLAWSFIPTITIFLISISVLNLWVPRYLLISTPYIIILLATSFVKVWSWKRPAAIVIALIYAIALSGGVFNYYGRLNKTDWRAAVQVVDTYEKPGDVIITTEVTVNDYVFSHYGSVTSPTYLLIDNNAVADVGYDLKMFKQKIEQLPNNRIWLFSRFGLKDVEGVMLNEAVLNLLEERYQVLDHQVFRGYVSTIDVVLLESRNHQ